jgi:hypothetical protein
MQTWRTVKYLPICQASHEPPLHCEVWSADHCYLALINLSHITDQTPTNEMSSSSTINASYVTKINEQEYFKTEYRYVTNGHIRSSFVLGLLNQIIRLFIIKPWRICCFQLIVAFKNFLMIWTCWHKRGILGGRGRKDGNFKCEDQCTLSLSDRHTAAALPNCEADLVNAFAINFWRYV